MDAKFKKKEFSHIVNRQKHFLIYPFQMYFKVGDRSGIGWGGVEGWGENADNCN